MSDITVASEKPTAVDASSKIAVGESVDHRPEAAAVLVLEALARALVPQVGERVRLPDGREIVIHAVMRRPAEGVLRIKAAGGDWIDGCCEMIEPA